LPLGDEKEIIGSMFGNETQIGTDNTEFDEEKELDYDSDTSIEYGKGYFSTDRHTDTESTDDAKGGHGSTIRS
jgi:hypothetical protein